MEKCSKYEALFTFASEKDFEEHLKICSDCKKQHEEMQKISCLVKEVKPFIKRKNALNGLKLKVAASFLLIFAAFFAINQFNLFQNEQTSSSEYSVIAQMGLPTDEYGLLLVE